MSDALSTSSIPSASLSYPARPFVPHLGPLPASRAHLAPRAAQPALLASRMEAARDRLRAAAVAGQRVRAYEVALDLDLSEFHFARQFRIAFGCSPHGFYDEVRAERARELLEQGHAPGVAARRVGLRRPAELRALLAKWPARSR